MKFSIDTKPQGEDGTPAQAFRKPSELHVSNAMSCCPALEKALAPIKEHIEVVMMRFHQTQCNDWRLSLRITVIYNRFDRKTTADRCINLDDLSHPEEVARRMVGVLQVELGNVAMSHQSIVNLLREASQAIEPVSFV